MRNNKLKQINNRRGLSAYQKLTHSSRVFKRNQGQVVFITGPPTQCRAASIVLLSVVCRRLSFVVVCNTPRRAVIRLEAASPAQARRRCYAASNLIIAGEPVVLRPLGQHLVWNSDKLTHLLTMKCNE